MALKLSNLDSFVPLKASYLKNFRVPKSLQSGNENYMVLRNKYLFHPFCLCFIFSSSSGHFVSVNRTIASTLIFCALATAAWAEPQKAGILGILDTEEHSSKCKD